MSQQPHQSASRIHARQNTNSPDIDDIMDLVDEHLAWQVESEVLSWDNRSLIDEYRAYQAQAEQRESRRRDSLGTLVVDWDGEGEMRAFYRGREGEEIYTSPTPTVQHSSRSHGLTDDSLTQASRPRRDRDGLNEKAISRHDSITAPSSPHRRPLPNHTITAHYSPTHNRVHGHDPTTHFTYDYNSRVIHVHHLGHSATSSPVSEYFALPVQNYVADCALQVAEKPYPAAPVKAQIVAFVEKILRKLDGLGILGRMRRERERRRKEGEGKGNSWVERGYVT